MFAWLLANFKKFSGMKSENYLQKMCCKKNIKHFFEAYLFKEQRVCDTTLLFNSNMQLSSHGAYLLHAPMSQRFTLLWHSAHLVQKWVFISISCFMKICSSVWIINHIWIDITSWCVSLISSSYILDASWLSARVPYWKLFGAVD